MRGFTRHMNDYLAGLRSMITAICRRWVTITLRFAGVNRDIGGGE